jgi:hypothetical protein
MKRAAFRILHLREGAFVPYLNRPEKHVPVAQLDRASDYGSEGREFESSRARDKKSRNWPSKLISGFFTLGGYGLRGFKPTSCNRFWKARIPADSWRMAGPMQLSLSLFESEVAFGELLWPDYAVGDIVS